MQIEMLERIDFLKSQLKLSLISESIPFNIIEDYKANN